MFCVARSRFVGVAVIPFQYDGAAWAIVFSCRFWVIPYNTSRNSSFRKRVFYSASEQHSTQEWIRRYYCRRMVWGLGSRVKLLACLRTAPAVDIARVGQNQCEGDEHKADWLSRSCPPRTRT